MIEKIEKIGGNKIMVTIAQEASILRNSVFIVQVCVPKDWTDQEVIDFTERECPNRGTFNWSIVRTGDRLLDDNPRRVNCAENENFVHMVLAR